MVGQVAAQQQMGDFLELGVVGQVGDVVTTVREAGAGLAHGTQRGFAGDLAAEAGASGWFFAHGVTLLPVSTGYFFWAKSSSSFASNSW